MNFDPSIVTMIRETECLFRLGLEIPLAAQALKAKQKIIKEKQVSMRLRLRVRVRVDDTHFSFSDPNSPLQGIPKYEIRMPCKVSGQLDQFVLGPQIMAQK